MSVALAHEVTAVTEDPVRSRREAFLSLLGQTFPIEAHAQEAMTVLAAASRDGKDAGLEIAALLSRTAVAGDYYLPKARSVVHAYARLNGLIEQSETTR